MKGGEKTEKVIQAGFGSGVAGTPPWGWLACILLFGATLFLRGIDHPLAGDELNMLQMARGERSLDLSGGNAIGYLPLLRAITVLSSTEVALRLPAVLFGVVGVALTYAFGSLLYADRMTGMAAALLLAVSPIYVYHSQYAHSYAAFGCVALASYLLIWRAHHEGSSRAWIGWAVTVGLGLWLHLFVIFVAAGQLFVWLAWQSSDRGLRLRRPQLRSFLRPTALGGIVVVLSLPLWLQWIGPLSGELLLKRRGGVSDYEILRSAPHFDLLSPEPYLTVLQRLLIWMAPLQRLWPWLGLGALAGFVGTAVRRSRVAGSLLGWALIPGLAIALFSHESGIDLGARRFLFLSPFLAVLWAAALRGVAGGWRRPAGAPSAPGARLQTIGFWTGVVMFAGLLGSTALDFYFRHSPVLDYRSAARVVELHERPQDIIYSWPPRLFEHEYSGSARFIGPATNGGPITRHLGVLEQGGSIWFVRPTGLDAHPYLGPQEELIRERGAARLHVGGGLLLSVLVSAESADRPSAADVAQAIALLKPTCAMCLAQWVRELEGADQASSAQRERARLRSLRSRDAWANWFR